MPELTIVRTYYPDIGRTIPTKIEVDGQKRPLIDFIKHPIGVGKLPCKVEAIWEGAVRTHDPTYLDDEYEIDTTTGVIVAKTALVDTDSYIGVGTIIHAGAAVSKSGIGSASEVMHGAIVTKSNLGRGCLVGAGIIIDHRGLDHFTVIDHQNLLPAPLEPPLDRRKYGHLDMRGDDPHRLP